MSLAIAPLLSICIARQSDHCYKKAQIVPGRLVYFSIYAIKEDIENALNVYREGNFSKKKR